MFCKYAQTKMSRGGFVEKGTKNNGEWVVEILHVGKTRFKRPIIIREILGGSPFPDSARHILKIFKGRIPYSVCIERNIKTFFKLAGSPPSFNSGKNEPIPATERGNNQLLLITSCPYGPSRVMQLLTFAHILLFFIKPIYRAWYECTYFHFHLWPEWGKKVGKKFPSNSFLGRETRAGGN